MEARSRPRISAKPGKLLVPSAKLGIRADGSPCIEMNPSPLSSSHPGSFHYEDQDTAQLRSSLAEDESFTSAIQSNPDRHSLQTRMYGSEYGKISIYLPTYLPLGMYTYKSSRQQTRISYETNCGVFFPDQRLRRLYAV